jgi:hypothetical protein
LFFRKLKIFGGVPKKALASSHPPVRFNLRKVIRLGYVALVTEKFKNGLI